MIAGAALQELEAALEAHPLVERAAVAVVGDEVEQRVVACVVGGPGGAPGAAELRRHLAAAASACPRPDAFVALDRLPLTPAGEPDRRALALATRGAAALARAPAMLGGLVADVADHWREVLDVESVRLGDDLFDLGGHSLAIGRISARIVARWGVEVPLVVFYDTPTIPGIASAIEELLGAET